MTPQKSLFARLFPFSWRDLAVSAAILSCAAGICIPLQRANSSDGFASPVFVLAVLCVSRFTTGYLFGLIASVLGVVCVNFIFTYPYWAVNFTLSGYPLTFLVFLAVSIAALIATRPLAHKMLDKTIVPTNADRVLHHTAKVTETIDNENTTGAVYIDGKTWTARSEDGDVIARGSMVTIVRMEGVKLFVRKEREEP